MSGLNWKTLYLASPLLWIFIGFRVIVPLLEDDYRSGIDLLKHRAGNLTITELSDQNRLLEASNKKLESRIQDLNSRIPQMQNLSGIYESLGAAAQRNSVRLSRIVPQPVERDSMLATLALDITIQGPFKEMLLFLHNLENTMQGFQLQSLVIENENRKSEQLTGKARLTVYLGNNSEDSIQK